MDRKADVLVGLLRLVMFCPQSLKENKMSQSLAGILLLIYIKKKQSRCLYVCHRLKCVHSNLVNLVKSCARIVAFFEKYGITYRMMILLCWGSEEIWLSCRFC